MATPLTPTDVLLANLGLDRSSVRESNGFRGFSFPCADGIGGKPPAQEESADGLRRRRLELLWVRAAENYGTHPVQTRFPARIWHDPPGAGLGADA